MPGMLITVAVEEGGKVKEGQKMMVLEAMKMETTINAPKSGIIKSIHAPPGTQVEAGDLLAIIE